MPQSPYQRRTTWMIAASILLLALIPFAVRQAGKSEDEKTSRDIQEIIPQRSNFSQSSPTRRSSRKASIKPPPSHQTEDLKSFLLPSSELSDVTLREALDHLFAQYREICQESGESPISFRYKIEGDFLTTLKHIAIMAGTTVKDLPAKTYHLTRANQGQPQTLAIHDENGILHEKTFIAERVDPTGSVIPVSN